jgi:serine/threonine protein kinase
MIAESTLASARITRHVTEEVSTDLAPPPAILRPGERLAGTPYLAVRLVGQGGMGEVYEVEHAELGRRAAVKVLHHQHVDRPDLAARLRDEARLSARLVHPNLVEVFDLGVTEDGRPWFAMPLLRGRDLRDELTARGPLPAARAAELCAAALDGLAAAHARGLVHRDIKLENLFLEDAGTLRVLDFGVAKFAYEGGRTEPGVSPGTPRTMAPEQCAGDAVDARTDLYAMGLALYELCTGRGPFDELRGSDHALRFAHCERRPAPPSQLAPGAIPAALDAIVLRALAKSPADRFQSAVEMAAALRSTIATRSGPPSEPRPRPSKRRPRRAANPWIFSTVSALAVAFFALGLAFGRGLPAGSEPVPARAGASAP